MVGRSPHVVDRALDFAALAAQGLTPTAIGRRRRRSKAYVSILLRLGEVLRGMDTTEVQALRHPRITWKLAQRVVRASTDPLTLRQQLRDALGGFSSHNVDRRRHRVGRLANPRAEPGTFTWRWDAAWATRDPAGYVAAYEAYLESLHTGITGRLVRALTQHAAAEIGVADVDATRTAPAVALAGQSLRQLANTVLRTSRPVPAPSLPPIDDAGRAALARLRALAPGRRAWRTIPDGEDA